MSYQIYALITSLLRKMERGDADSSSSTLRVFGVVAIVLLVVLTIGGLLITIFPTISNAINAGLNTMAGWLP